MTSRILSVSRLLTLVFVVGLIVVSNVSISNAAEPKSESELFPKNATILFQGDSITDGNRGRNLDPNHILGHGYAFLTASALSGRNPEMNWTFLNRGVSGNTVLEMRQRWDEDTIALKPDVLSIMIGVNDYWRGESPEEYRAAFDELLSYTKQELPDTKLIVIEPFATLPTSLKEGANIADYQDAARDLANKYGAVYVLTQEMFMEHIANEPSEKYWIWDGVHPTYSGHWLLYEAWLKAVLEAE